MSSDRPRKGRKAKSSPKGELPSTPRASRDEPARPSVFPLPETRSSRSSLAPPAPPISQAAPAPTVHELFDIETAEVDHARDAAARRQAERVSARPHPPKRARDASQTPPPVEAKVSDPDDPAQRLSTPLSWAAAKARPPEELPEDLLEPVMDSAPLVLPPLSGAEPLASAIPTGSVVVPPPRPPERHWGKLGLAVAGAIGLVVIGLALGAENKPEDGVVRPRVEQRPANPAAQTDGVTNEEIAAAPSPSPPLELDLGVPLSPPQSSAEPEPPPAPASAEARPLPSAAGVPPPPAVEHPPFDGNAASAALSEAAASSAVCKKPGDPNGSATVIVRYAPSGRVTSATVEAGPFAGTVTGGCIAMMFRKALVPPFSGDYVTVKKTVTLK